MNVTKNVNKLEKIIVYDHMVEVHNRPTILVPLLALLYLLGSIFALESNGPAAKTRYTETTLAYY